MATLLRVLQQKSELLQCHLVALQEVGLPLDATVTTHVDSVDTAEQLIELVREHGEKVFCLLLDEPLLDQHELNRYQAACEWDHTLPPLMMLQRVEQGWFSLKRLSRDHAHFIGAESNRLS